jgi:hypothetical protein
MKTIYLYEGYIPNGQMKGPAWFEADKQFPLNVEHFFRWGSIKLKKLILAIKCPAGLTPLTGHQNPRPLHPRANQFPTAG